MQETPKPKLSPEEARKQAEELIRKAKEKKEVGSDLSCHGKPTPADFLLIFSISSVSQKAFLW